MFTDDYECGGHVTVTIAFKGQLVKGQVKSLPQLVFDAL